MPKFEIRFETPFYDIPDRGYVTEADSMEEAIADFVPSSVDQIIEEYKASSYAKYDGWEDWFRDAYGNVLDYKSNDEFEITAYFIKQVSDEKDITSKVKAGKKLVLAAKEKLEEMHDEDRERKELARLQKKYGKKSR